MSTPALPQRYSIASLLGEGGQGRVYRVQDSLRDRELALKLVSASDAEFLRREFDTLRQIRHENLIQVFDWGTLESGEAFYTMELVEGEDWGRRMGTAQPAEEVRRILTGVLRGLAHLHSYGEIHGDLKPGNILLGRGGVVKVSDVGMGGSGEGSVAGTPGYTAPECWEGNRPDVRSDIYSIGVMGYEALTGKHPFGGRTIREVVAVQMEGWVLSPGAHQVRVPADMERAVMRALERKSRARQGSADEFMEILGVEDSVGMILGGRFVGRGAELAEIEQSLVLRDPKSPTYFRLVGPVGSGRSALIAEVAHRAYSLRIQVIEWDDGTLDGLSRTLNAEHLQERQFEGSPDDSGVSLVAEFLLSLTQSGLVLVTSDPPEELADDARNLARRIARYVSAVALERQIPLPLVILQSGPTAAHQDESFERTLALKPFDAAEISLVISGLLGQAHIESELQAEFAMRTTGLPHQVIGGLLGLVGSGILVRRAGEWRFLERERIRDLEYSGDRDNLAAQWAGLSPDHRLLLTTLAVVVAGLTTRAIAAVMAQGESAVRAHLNSLSIRGWTLERRGEWRLSSFSVVDEVLVQTTLQDQQELARKIVERAGESLEAESLADARAQASRDFDLQMTAVVLAQGRRDFRLAERRATRAEEWARASNTRTNIRRASLARAESLHRLGRDPDARALLVDSDLWGGDGVEKTASQGHAKILGRVHLALGDLDGARTCFQAVIEGSDEGDLTATVLNAHADLAEIEWRHGDGAQRERCIERLRSIVAQTTGRDDLANSRAGLLYQLGAALIEAGRREEARDVLEAGLLEPCGAYWRMRIRNALAAAVYYLGDFERTLALLGEAWKDAEVGGFDSFKARIMSNRAGLYYGMGRFSDAVEHHGLSAMWARRTGSAFEFLAASLGASINCSLLAKFEPGIQRAQDAWATAAALPNVHDMAKALEMEAFALHQLGDDAAALETIRKLASELPDRGFDDVQPRIDWLEARIEARRGNYAQAENLLKRAENVLTTTKDWEDLPGVQIELDRLALRKKAGGASWGRISQTTTKAITDGALVVALRGGLALSEVLADGGIDDGDLLRRVEAVLALAEAAGARDFVWRISAGIGHGAIRSGEREIAQKRFAHAVRVLREIAGELSETHRRLYLSTPHGKSLLGFLENSR